ncbi:MAG: TatD family hydrolase [Clostridia bacterium]|nr:TatD family hydrolase [Clostridia bacterium]
MEYFDSHAHYDDAKFDIDRDEILSIMQQNSVSNIINAGTNIKTSKISIELANKYDFIYAAIGIHPENVFENESVDDIKALYSPNKKIVAIGEIGLDYYYDTSNKDIQKKYFVSQLNLANELNLPVIIHDRDAHGDTLDILKNTPLDKKGVLHCYSGSLESAKIILNLGFYLGFGGTLTFNNAKSVPEVLKYAPLDRILIETDSPYLAPNPYRGKRNNSMYLKYVVEKIAELKNISEEEISEITKNNAKKLFGIS